MFCASLFSFCLSNLCPFIPPPSYFLACLQCLHIDLALSSCFFASQSDIYFVSSAPVSSASNCSSRDTSSQSSPQTPTGYEMPMFPSPLSDGKPSPAKALEDVDVRPSTGGLFKCQHCLQICLTLDAAVLATLIYINFSQQSSWSCSLLSSTFFFFVSHSWIMCRPLGQNI